MRYMCQRKFLVVSGELCFGLCRYMPDYYAGEKNKGPILQSLWKAELFCFVNCKQIGDIEHNAHWLDRGSKRRKVDQRTQLQLKLATTQASGITTAK